MNENVICMLGLEIGDDELRNLCLVEIERLLNSNGRSLKDYNCMPYPQLSDYFQYENRYIVDERAYDKEQMEAEHACLLKLLTAEQEKVYNEIMNSVISNSSGFYFLYGYGGHWRDFSLENLICRS